MSGVYYEKEGVPVGPVSGPAFAALYESGAANDTTRVWTEDLPAWMPLGACKDQIPGLGATPAMPPLLAAAGLSVDEGTVGRLLVNLLDQVDTLRGPVAAPASAAITKVSYPSGSLCTTKRGIEVLRDPELNKGTAFTAAERSALGLVGLIPGGVMTMQQQVARSLVQMRALDKPLDKYKYLQNLSLANEHLCFKVVMENVQECMPLVYTPTVGAACQNHGHLFTASQGIYISINDLGNVRSILDSWPVPDVRCICMTDGERILGLGDLGAWGMGIPIGKLQLYTACGLIDPSYCLPVQFDTGCNRESMRNDPDYYGMKCPRVRDGRYDALVDEFMCAARDKWGESCILQFEDFANQNAFRLLRKYIDDFCTFNDDIQGTACVALAGLLGMIRVPGIKKTLAEHRIMFFGAGSAALGIADLICDYMVDQGVSMDEARRCIYCVDSRGLITKGRGNLNDEKERYAVHTVEEVGGVHTDLYSAVCAIKPTALIGVSTIGGAFTPAVLKKMAEFNERPIISALSNPTSKAECTASAAYEHTQGRCVFSSGSPFGVIPGALPGGVDAHPGQGNNAYIFPGIALGVVASKAKRIPQKMFLVAAETLASLVDEDEFAHGCMFPYLSRIHEASIEIAVKVAETAEALKLNTIEAPAGWRAAVVTETYNAEYSDVVAV